jgi:tetratricopeptide (TPR) repeat protein
MSRMSRWVAAIAIAGAALAVGTVHTPTLCAVAAAMALATVLAWWQAEPMNVRSAATVLFLTGLGLTAYTMVQCIPMPIAWLAKLAPYNADVWSRALVPLHEAGPTWAPISLDPTATRVEVLKGVTYLLAFVTALLIARRREGIQFLSGTIVVTALALAAAALLHPAFGAHTLFGVYKPGPGISERHLAPLMNPNNLAGYINIALCLSLAVTLAPRSGVPRPVAGAIALVLAATQVWVASRAGVVTMVLGALIVVGIAFLTRTRQSRTAMAISIGTALAMVVGATCIVLGGSDDASAELLDADVSKLGMLTATLRGLPSMPFLGCGRGAFESVYPAFRSEPGYVTYTHPENVVVQWIVEWGVPFGVAGLVLVVSALRPNVVLARSATAGGAWAGVIAVAVQNLSDLGSEIPGLVVAGVVCAAIIVAGVPGREHAGRVHRWALHPRRLATGALVATAAVLCLVIPRLGRELHDDQDLLRVQAEHRVPLPRLLRVARAAMLRHPSEPYIPFVVSTEATQPIPWVEATLERSRVYGPAHLVLARTLARRAPSQARLEYRLAMIQATDLVGEVMREAPRLVDGPSDALELVPSGKPGVPIMEQLVGVIAARLPSTRVMLDLDIAARAPTAKGPTERIAEDAVDDVEAPDGAPWCGGSARSACVQEALAKATRVVELSPDGCVGFALHARARLAGGDPVGAVAELENAADHVTDRVSCLKELVALARKAHDASHVESSIDKVVSSGCGDEVECAQNLQWAAQAYESEGQRHKALALYKRAMNSNHDDSLLGHVAALASEVGLHAEAAEDYQQLARRHPDNVEWQRLAGVEHDAAMRAAERL